MNTRKKVIKTVYKDDDGSEEEGADFSDASSEVKYSGDSSSEEEEDLECVPSSGDEFEQRKSKASTSRKPVGKKPKFAKNFIKKINRQTNAGVGPSESEDPDVSPALFSVKDLTEADKLLPPILNLSESDSSEDESPRPSNKSNISSMSTSMQNEESESDNEQNTEYKDIWSNLKEENSEEIAKKTFMELEQHKSKIEEAKVSLQNYAVKTNTNIVKQESSDVKDLLALGEDVQPQETFKNRLKVRKVKNDSDSEMEDWEEVKETKAIPQQGIQLFVEFPDGGCRKSKKVDVEMMMRRKINRVKKEYQVYMHKVHVLCWIGHGNYVNRVLNDQEIMAAVLALVPSKECYPGERVDMKYVEQISTWYKNKMTLKQDKNEDKFKPKAPPLKDILLEQIKKKIVTTRKYIVFVFVAMLRALGLQCRVMFNFVTLPIKPPSFELCSLSIKPKDQKSVDDKAKPATEKKNAKKSDKKVLKNSKKKISQVDGNDDDFYSENENIMQLDGNYDSVKIGRKTRSTKRPKAVDNTEQNEDVSPPKLPKQSSDVSSEVKHNKKDVAQESNRTQRMRNRNANSNDTNVKENTQNLEDPKKLSRTKRTAVKNKEETKDSITTKQVENTTSKTSKRRQKSMTDVNKDQSQNTNEGAEKKPTTTAGRKTSSKNEDAVSSDSNKLNVPTISIKDENDKDVSSKYFKTSVESTKSSRLSRKRSQTAIPANNNDNNTLKPKGRTKSAPNNSAETSMYFNENVTKKLKKEATEDNQRVSHRDLTKNKSKANNDVTADLIGIMKKRIKEAKNESKKGLVKGKITKESDEDSDYLPVEDPKRKSGSDDDFKPTKISPKPSASRIKDRRVLSSTEDEPVKTNKIDVWCEIFVEELEQWISVDVIKGKIHSTGDLYNNATHPVCYVVGWDNSNYLKDLTRKYVPHWNTVTRKQRVEPAWWDKTVRPWLGPKTARDREEDEYLDRMQLEAPLPKSIAEYKNHPLYALKRHLLKFEAIYPPDASVLGFVRNEPVYARECVYTCRSRDTWLKEAKVVKLGEQPYKVVKARPKWDKLSNKLLTDKPLEVFGPWQVNDYEPPVAENGIVPRNAYGNVELFKDCMLPVGTVHIKLPGLNRVAKKLNIDCAPAMTGFDFNGGWSHPVYDGFVVCKEFEEIITEAWAKDQEEQERRELEKLEARVYGNWKRLIKGLLIKERLKNKYGFEEPKTESAKSKGPRLVVKKKS